MVLDVVEESLNEFTRQSFAADCPTHVARLPHVACRGRAAPSGREELVVMVLDVVEEGSGRFLVWGTDARGASALLCVADFEPYFYVAGPRDQVAPQRPCRTRV